MARILIAEDEHIIREVGAEALLDAGYDVVEAATAAEAIDILENCTEVQLLFTDVRMPGAMDGLKLAELVHERWPAIKLLITSGDRILSDREMPDDGHFLSKPYRIHDLQNEVRSLIESR